MRSLSKHASVKTGKTTASSTGWSIELILPPINFRWSTAMHAKYHIQGSQAPISAPFGRIHLKPQSPRPAR